MTTKVSDVTSHTTKGHLVGLNRDDDKRIAKAWGHKSLCCNPLLGEIVLLNFSHKKCLTVISKRDLSNLTRESEMSLWSNLWLRVIKEINMKFRMHHKFCSKPPKSFDKVRMPNKATMLKDQQLIEAERVHE